MPRCVITDYMGDDPSLELSILDDAGIDAYIAPTADPVDWKSQARTADAILTRHAPIDGAIVNSLTSCKIIARYGTGHDNIDIAAAEEKRIVVTKVVDYATEEVAAHTMALTLALNRALPTLHEEVSSGGWTPNPLPHIPRLAGKTLGLLGCGRIGAAVARRARSFNLNVLAFDPYANNLPSDVERATSLEHLLGDSHVLSLHAPLTSETENVIGERELTMLPPGALVINVARGGLLDLDAAMSMVERGELGGLGLDVTPVEPLPEDHTARNHPRVIVTPHVGYYSLDSVADAKRMSVGEIVRVLAGEPPLNPVFTLEDT